jgi:hypothetical protein
MSEIEEIRAAFALLPAAQRKQFLRQMTKAVLQLPTGSVLPARVQPQQATKFPHHLDVAVGI